MEILEKMQIILFLLIHIGRKEINKYQTFVKFVCAEVKEPKTDA